MGGFKVNTSISKIKQTRARKSKNSKTNKVLVKDYMTHLVGNLAQSVDILGLESDDPLNRQKMEELPIL